MCFAGNVRLQRSHVAVSLGLPDTTLPSFTIGLSVSIAFYLQCNTYAHPKLLQTPYVKPCAKSEVSYILDSQNKVSLMIDYASYLRRMDDTLNNTLV